MRFSPSNMQSSQMTVGHVVFFSVYFILVDIFLLGHEMLLVHSNFPDLQN